jgi:hypothetical protein
VIFRWLMTLAWVSVTTGCVTTTVQEMRQASTGISASESVVVLGRHDNAAKESEDSFISCVSNNLGGKGGVGVVNEQTFVDALFPWFEPRTAPLKTADLPDIVMQPLLANRLQSIGVRYLIWIEGTTETTDKGGALTCSITMTGAGCFGFLSWENDSSYEAQIWDLKNGNVVGKVSSDATGTSFMPAVIVPVPFIARVQAGACSSLSGQLKAFITKES